MSILIIKIIACVTMIFDHIKYAIPLTNNFITEYMGRISFPLFAFLITEGYTHTKDLKKYYKRLIIFALISQIPFMLFRTLVGEYRLLNVLFTLLLGLIAIMIYEKIDKKYISIPLVLLIIYLGKIMRVDYGWYGVATVFIIYVFNNNKNFLVSTFIALNIIYHYDRLFINYSVENLITFLFTISSVIIIVLYNGKLGKKVKYFFYYFYPVHMIVLYLINRLIIC